MNSTQRYTALAMARAMLAGPPTASGLTGRIHACLGRSADWSRHLAERCAAWPARRWSALDRAALADWIEGDVGFQHAWLAHEPPRVRHYFLTEAKGLRPRPLGLHELALPDWPHEAALARWLGLSCEGLDDLARAAPWQRRLALDRQHYGYTLHPKSTGGWRLLEAPRGYLKRAQRRILHDLLDHVPPHEAAFGYVGRRNVVCHAQMHTGQPVVLRFDLTDFFASVRASRVHALFTTLGYGPGPAGALTALCTTSTPEPVLRRLHQDGGLPWGRLQRLRDAHLPQGAPTSAALANLCAFGLDVRLEGLACGCGARYSRYADDLVLSGGRGLGQARERIEARVAQIVRDEGFELNHRKTRCMPNTRRQRLCGVVVNERTNVSREDFDTLKAILHRCALHGPSQENRERHPHWQEHLRGRLSWAKQLNPCRGERLERLWQAIDWAR